MNSSDAIRKDGEKKLIKKLRQLTPKITIVKPVFEWKETDSELEGYECRWNGYYLGVRQSDYDSDYFNIYLLNEKEDIDPIIDLEGLYTVEKAQGTCQKEAVYHSVMNKGE